ncbi:hypothetical protein J2S34_000796 [Nitrobacter winogradskyi]|uniref:Uncharacterized protein n=1 Tax=Nitrobacter winogradskyi TaxID=913 RepID=A0ACC6AF62_NITWI|nr:hypothetical protein [Nitrobacter winogradskyi]
MVSILFTLVFVGVILFIVGGRILNRLRGR